MMVVRWLIGVGDGLGLFFYTGRGIVSSESSSKTLEKYLE